MEVRHLIVRRVVSLGFGVFALLGLTPSLSARFFVPEPTDVQALRQKVADLELRGDYQQIPILLESLVADEPNVNEPLRKAALQLLVDQLRLRRESLDRLLKLLDLANTEGWRYQIGFQYWVLVVNLEATEVGRISQLIRLAETGGFSKDDTGLRRWAARELCSMGTSFLGGKLHGWAADRLDQIGTAKSLHVLALYGARLAVGEGWETSRHIAKRLREHGWSDETIRLYGLSSHTPVKYDSVAESPGMRIAR